MKFEGKGTRKKVLSARSPELLGMGQEQTVRFDVDKLMTPQALDSVRQLFQGLVSSGRMYNAANLVSAMTLAYGKRPEGFKRESELQGFKGYMGAMETAYAADEVLAFLLLAYPEDRPFFQQQIERFWQIKTRGKKLPVMVNPTDLVKLRIVLPEQRENYYLGEVSLVKERKEVLSGLKEQKGLSQLADKIIDLLLVDPSFKNRIPGVDEVIQEMEQDFLSFSRQGTDEAWKHAAMLLRCLTLLSADQVGIDKSGSIFTVRAQPLPSATPLPERPVT